MTSYVTLSILPMTDEDSWQQETRSEALGYITHKAAELLLVDGLGGEDRKNLEETIMSVLQKVLRHDREGKHQEHALRIMRTLSVL